MALAWVDRNRRCFIATTRDSTDGSPCERLQWHQTSTGPRRVQLSIRQVIVVERYYDTCSVIDQHNKCHQNDLEL